MFGTASLDLSGTVTSEGASTQRSSDFEGSRYSGTDLSQTSGVLKSLFPSPELSRFVHSCDSQSMWDFTSSSLIQRPGLSASVFHTPPSQTKPKKRRSATAKTAAVFGGKGNVLFLASSALDLNTCGKITPRTRSRSADYVMKKAPASLTHTESSRTLGDASSSSLPTDPQRSTSTSTTATESACARSSVAALVKRRQEIEERLAFFQVQLLESFREEWVLTGKIPDGFAEVQTEVLSNNPKLKTTSFPMTHLLPSSHSDSQLKSDVRDVIDSEGALHLSTEGDENQRLNGSFILKDSLTSSFSSVMGDSFYWSQFETLSSRALSLKSDAPSQDKSRIEIYQRLQALEVDCAVLTQIYRIHKQRASETNRAAFRIAYKTNAQKLKELSREKEALLEKLREMDRNEHLEPPKSVRPSRHCGDQTQIGTPISAMATLPRRKTYRLPLSSGSSTLKLGKLIRRSSTKLMGSGNDGTTQIGKSTVALEDVPQPSNIVPKGPRKSLLPSLFRGHGPQKPLPSMSLQAGALVPHGKLQAVDWASKSPRPLSFIEVASLRSNRRSQSEADLLRLAVKSSPLIIQKLGGTEYHGETCEESSSGGRERDTATVEIQEKPIDLTLRFELLNDTSKECHGSTSAVRQVHAREDVCMRRHAETQIQESPIRCICSCISEHGGTCECAEEAKDCNGNDVEVVATTTPIPQARMPVIIEKKHPRRSMNPLNLFRAQSGRWNHLWSR